jgi:hypothetical protein
MKQLPCHSKQLFFQVSNLMSQQGFVLFIGFWGMVKLSLPKYYLTHLCWETYTLSAG